MNKDSYKVDYAKLDKIILTAQLLIAGCILITEIIDNYILYATRSQGYGPDTIVQKLIRYLLVPTIINFGLVLFAYLGTRKNKDITSRKFTMLLCATLMCADVASTHYQFASTFIIFIIPLLFCVLYEDNSLIIAALVMSLIGQTFAIIARAIDPLYNKDIIPEAAIAYIFSIGFFFISRIIIRTLISRRNDLANALVDTEKANANLERAKLSLKMLETLAKTIDAKDKYTNGHSGRVASYATILAENLGWKESHVEMLKYEALLHDIGKIGVPDSVLNKPGKLTKTEFEIIKSHTLVGADILKNMIAVPNAYAVAKHHHERYDGKGYPNGLSGEDIPINARIICIADAYDAMNSDRIYRKALSHDIIREELVNGSGTQFDPELLAVFLDLFDNHKLIVKTDTLISNDCDADHEYIMNDIERVIRKMSDIDSDEMSANDFTRFYKYMRNIGIRYNHSVEVVSVMIVSADDKHGISEEISEMLDIAIRKNIRSVDVYHRYSDDRYMIILLDAGIDNIDVITKRITFDFKSSNTTAEYNLTFEVNESIQSKSKEPT